MFVSWHLAGISLAEYQQMTRNERLALHKSLNRMIERVNEEGAAPSSRNDPMR